MQVHPQRSPISAEALTLGELRRLTLGTRLIMFDWSRLSRERMTYPGTSSPHIRFPEDLVTLVRGWEWEPGRKIRSGEMLSLEPFHFGLVPLVHFGWNQRRVLVLAEHGDSLPRRSR